MIASALYRISGRLPCRIISDGERYYVGSAFGWTCYLHRFIASDPDRGLHDHPWSKAYSFILSGWYIEERRLFAERRFVRWFNSLTGDTFHRVVIPNGDECWTLFMHNERVKTWGFLRPFFAGGQRAGDLFNPYVYRDGEVPSDKLWWLTAPTGAFINRQAAS